MNNSNKSGWVRLHRQIEDNFLYFLEPFTKAQAWIDLFLNANHKSGIINIRGNLIEIKRGQIGWSELTMAKRWQWSKNKVRRFLNLLETKQQTIQQKTHLTTIITILKYEDFQKDEKTKQQTIQQKDNRRYTNKNDKNDKNDNNILQPTVADEIIYEPENSEAKKTLNKQIFGLMAKFRDYNPVIKINHKTHRKSCEDLINQFGYEKALNTVKYALALQGRQFVPTITTPTQLINKLGDLKVYAERQKAQTPTIVKI